KGRSRSASASAGTEPRERRAEVGGAVGVDAAALDASALGARRAAAVLVRFLAVLHAVGARIDAFSAVAEAALAVGRCRAIGAVLALPAGPAAVDVGLALVLVDR